LAKSFAQKLSTLCRGRGGGGLCNEKTERKAIISGGKFIGQKIELVAISLK
jgi:hypothetical protein